MISLLAAVVMQQNTLPTAPITYETVGKPVGRVVQELGKILGMRLETTAQTSHEVVVVTATHVPANELLSRLAFATGSQWQSLGTGFRLVANQTQRQRDARTERALLGAQFRKLLAQAIKDLEVIKKSTMQRNVSPEPSDDTSETVARILATLDAAIIGNLEADDRLVFSDNPTAMQGQLLPSALDIIRNWYATSRKAISVAGAMTDAVAVDRQARPNEPIGTSLLIVKCGNDGNLSAQLKLYGTNGKLLRNLWYGLSVLEAQDEQKPAASPSGTPVEYSKESEALLAFDMTSCTQVNDFPVPENVQALLRNPEARDPLSFTISDCLISWAKFLHKPLVADVPDRAADTWQNPASKQTVEGFDQILKSGTPMKATENGDWLIVRPTTPERARIRIDRAALSRLILESGKQAYVSLSQIAKYAKTSPLGAPDGFEAMDMLFFVPGILGLQTEMDNGWSMVRFYGTLTTAQFNQLEREGSLSFDQLSDEQKQLSAACFTNIRASISTTAPRRLRLK